MNTPTLQSTSSTNSLKKSKTNYQDSSNAHFYQTEMQRANVFAPCHEVFSIAYVLLCNERIPENNASE